MKKRGQLAVRTATRNDLRKIIDLQIGHHIQNVPVDKRKKHGFVTLLTTSRQLVECIDRRMVWVAVVAGDVVGYIIFMEPDIAENINFLEPLVERINNLALSGEKYLILGQILVVYEHSGGGIGGALLSRAEKNFAPNFSHIVTEVSLANQKSLKFHRQQDFTEKEAYDLGGQTFSIICKDLRIKKSTKPESWVRERN